MICEVCGYPKNTLTAKYCLCPFKDGIKKYNEKRLKELDEKLEQAFKNDKSHTEKMSQ